MTPMFITNFILIIKNYNIIVESFCDFIRVYEGKFSDGVYSRFRLEPTTTTHKIIQEIILKKGLDCDYQEFCLIECNDQYGKILSLFFFGNILQSSTLQSTHHDHFELIDIETILTESDTPLPSENNLEIFEEGSFLLRKKSFVETLQTVFFIISLTKLKYNLNFTFFYIHISKWI